MHYDEILTIARSRRALRMGSPRVSVSGRDEQAAAVFAAINKGIDREKTEVDLVMAGSFGYYDLEPIVSIARPGKATLLYPNVNQTEAGKLVNEYLLNDGANPDRALCTVGEEKVGTIPRAGDVSLFTLQSRISLRNCGLVDPESIDDYLCSTNGYAGLSNALQTSRADLAETLRASRLSDGKDWGLAEQLRMALEGEDGQTIIVCRAIEGDPLSLTSRILFEGDPHAILEGMLITAYSAGARHCIICADSRWTTGIGRLEKALEEMSSYGLTGDNILGSSFSCRIEIRQIPPSLVMGEDTALVRHLEGKQAMPVLRHSDPGLFRISGKQGLIATTEVFSGISALLQGDSRVGNPGNNGSSGTKVVTLSGDVLHPYTVEVPSDTTVRAIVEDIGGGVAAGRSIKAVQFGGPTGSFLGPTELNVPVSLQSSCPENPVIKSTTIEVFDSGRCAVEIAGDRMAYLQEQSCGKCVFCREGTFQMSEILKGVSEQGATLRDLDQLAELGEAMAAGSICEIGKTAAGPILSGLKLFRHEYEAHIATGKCPVANNT